ncbi:MAG: glycerol-3-phosphate dehydrogenase/oxidase [Euryarchaeota archaeon]|nr:glycerol-3-phosphate dehydrogenase/oxidase [Euryarchaeota archaeon]
MKRDITRLSKKKYDVLIIGAGIYGAATAWDAASRGLSVALLDKNDFGSKTSFNSQKIIHGGLRYLQHGDFKRVRESACERTSLMRIAPHLVHPMPCLIPIYGQTMRFIMPLALKTFDLFSYDRNTLKDPQKHIPNSRIVSKAECMQLIPGLMEDGLSGGSICYDAQAYNTERLVLSFIRSAEKAGADVANYLEVIDFIIDENRIKGIKAKDLLNSEELEIRAEIVVNASGPWINQISSLLPSSVNPDIRFVKMLIIIVKRIFIQDYAFGIQFRKKFKDKDNIVNKGYRLLFITPWRKYSLVGAAQQPYNGDIDNPLISEDEILKLIEEVNEAYPQAALTHKDVSFYYRGLLPIDNINQNGDIKVSKHNEIYDYRKSGIEGLISIISVKYTTARNAAQMVTDMVYKELGKPLIKCKTMKTPIYGGNIERFDDFLLNAIEHRPPTLDKEIIRNLVYNYGSEYQKVLKYLDEDAGYGQRITDISNVIKAEIIHAIRDEMAQKLEDVVMRRTELGSAEYPGDEGLETCACIMAQEMGWGRSRIQEEISNVKSLYAPLI